MPHYVLLALFLFTLAASTVQATTLVAIWSPDELLIGADSLVTTSSGRAASACKIVQEGGMYFAVSGLAEDRSSKYDLVALARQAARESQGLPQTLVRFTDLVHEPLADSVSRLKHDSPAEYRALEGGRPVVEVIFAEAGVGAPGLGVASFQLGPEGALGQYSAVLADEFDRRGPRIIYAGQQSRIRKYLASHRNWYGLNRTALIRDLIQLEIDHTSGHVGPPVDILAIRPGSTAWLQRKLACDPS